MPSRSRNRGLDCGEALGLDLADSGANQRAGSPSGSVLLAGAGVRVRREAVGAALAHELGRRPRCACGPCSPSSEETLTCSSAPASMCGSSRSSGPRDALRVGEQQAVAEAGEAGDGGVEDVIEARERALEQQPRRVLRALGDQLPARARRAPARPRRRARRRDAGGRRGRRRRSRAAPRRGARRARRCRCAGSARA